MSGRYDPEHLEQPEPKPAEYRDCYCDKRVPVEFVIEYWKCFECGYEACQHIIKEYDNNVCKTVVALCEDCVREWRNDGKLHIEF